MQLHSTKNSNKDTPSSIYGSSDKKMRKMPTIKEDMFESQQNTSCKKTRNNEDLKDVTGYRSPSKKSFADLSSMSNMLENRDISISVTSVRNSNRKGLAKSKSKKTIQTDYSKVLQGLQNSYSSKGNQTLTNRNYTKGNLF